MLNYTVAATIARKVFELNLLLAKASASAVTRRALYGPRRAGWSWPFESVVGMMHSRTPCREEMSEAEVRAALERVDLPLPRDVRIEPAVGAGAPAEWTITPNARPGHAILSLHGGGYVCGSPRSHRSLVSRLARAAGMAALSLDYRLAPEHPYPAALEDAWLAYWWLLGQGIAPERIAVAGDSAGGGLTAALLLALRDAGAPLPAAAVLFSPWLDLALKGVTIQANAECDFLNLQILRRTAGMYLGSTDPRTPHASPLYADLAGLPPLLVQAGTAEMLFDDARRFAQRAATAGVAVEFEPWENMIHVWQFLAPIEASARLAIRSAGRFIRKHMFLPQPKLLLPQAAQMTQATYQATLLADANGHR